MLIELSDNKDLIGPWVFNRVNRAWGPEGRTAIGLVDGDRVLAGVVFEDYTMKSVVGHVTVDNPNIPLRRLIAATFYYVFVDLGVDKFLGFVNSANRAALKFDLRLGFRPEAVIKDVFSNGDLFIMVMDKADCRWLPKQLREAA